MNISDVYGNLPTEGDLVTYDTKRVYACRDTRNAVNVQGGSVARQLPMAP